jgi:tetratricopeptide (TPR) repeat protein
LHNGGHLDLALLPSDLRAAISLQIADLSDDACELLQVAAVAGTVFAAPEIAGALGIDTPELFSILEEAVEARVVAPTSPPSEFRFRHALLRDALYQGLSTARRSVLHERMARALVNLHGAEPSRHLSTIAHHFYEAASAGRWDESIDFSGRAAEYSASCLAYEDSAHHYQRAIEVLELATDSRRERQAAMLVRLGAQLTKSGDRVGARDAFERALRSPGGNESSRLIAEAALSLAPGVLALESGVVDAFLIELLEEALSGLSADNSGIRARLTARLSLALHWAEDSSIARHLASEAREFSKLTSDPEAIASAIQAEWSSRHGPDHREARSRLSAELLASPCEGATEETQLVSQLFAIYSALECGAPRDLALHLESFRHLALHLRQPQGQWFAEMLDGMAAMLAGQFDRGARLLGRFSTLGSRVNDANSVHSALAHAAYLSFERGDLSQLIPAAQQIAQDFPSVDVWKSACAWMLALTRRHSDAQAQLRRMGGAQIARLPSRMDLNGTLCLAGEAAALVRDNETAQAIYGRLLPLSDGYAVLGLGTLSWGSVARVLGLLAESLGLSEAAIEHMRDAVANNEKIGARAWLARSQFELARMLVDAQRPVGEPGQLILRAGETARELGMSNLTREIESLRSSTSLPRSPT